MPVGRGGKFIVWALLGLMVMVNVWAGDVLIPGDPPLSWTVTSKVEEPDVLAAGV